MLCLIRRNSPLNLKSRYFCSLKPYPWIRKESIEFYDQISLESHQSTQKLIEIFKHPESYKLKNAEKDIFLNFMLKDHKEEKRIREVCSFLTGRFDSKLLSFNILQLRFPTQFFFYWNYHLLKAYNDAVFGGDIGRANTTNYFAGPKHLGKSFNLAFYRNLLSSDPHLRVIYIHNPEANFKSVTPFKLLLDDLQFTFARDIKNGDATIIKALDACYRATNESFKAKMKTLASLMDCCLKNKALPVLLIDQHNIFSKFKALAEKEYSFVKECYQETDVFLENLIPPLCWRRILVAFMTGEAPERKSQEVNYRVVNQSLPEDMTRIFITESFANKNLTEDEIRTIWEVTKGVPGEIKRVSESEGNKIIDKIFAYNEKRYKEVMHDFQMFITKTDERPADFQENATLLMAQMSIFIDTDVPLSYEPDRSLFDERYIRIEDGKVISMFPAVKRALREKFCVIDVYVRLMQKHYKDCNYGSLGVLYNNFMIDAFVKSSERSVEMVLQSYEKEPNSYTFNGLKKKDLVLIEKIDLRKEEYDTVYVPLSPNLRDIDLVVYLSSSKTLFIIQFKYKDSLLTNWKSSCKGTDGKSRKNELAKMFKEQIKDLDIKFVLGFVQAEYTETELKNKLRDFGSDVYFWNTNQVEGLQYLELDQPPNYLKKFE